MEVLNMSNNMYLKKLSKKNNKAPQEIINEALKLYEQYNSLLEEFEEWDAATEEDFLKFENSLK